MYIIKDTSHNEPAYFVSTKYDEEVGIQKRILSATIYGATKYRDSISAEEVVFTVLGHKSGFKVYPVCPICGKDYSEPPAISRNDNKTPICSTCSTKEALQIYIKHKESSNE